MAQIRRRDDQRAERLMRTRRCRAVEHWHALSAIAKGRVPVWHVGLRGRDHWHLLTHLEIGRMERRERGGPLRAHPTHAGPELTDGVNGKLHERQRRLVRVLHTSARDIDGHEPPGDFLNGGHGQAAKVGRANLGEEPLHQQGRRVQVGNGNQGVGGALVGLNVADRDPEKPSPQGLEALKLLGDGQSGADLARALEEADQVLHLSGVFLVVLQMSLNLDDLLQGSLVGLKVVLLGLVNPAFRIRRSRGRGERAALRDEVCELRLVLPWFHCINHLPRKISQRAKGKGGEQSRQANEMLGSSSPTNN